MTSERQFLLDREDSDFLSLPCFSGGVARENESRFRKIHFTRQSLHLGIIQSASIGEDRQRITCQRRLSEYINLSEFVGSARHKTPQFALNGAIRNEHSCSDPQKLLN